MSTTIISTKPTVDKVVVKWKMDDSPDTSWIGEYSNIPKQGAIETGRSGRYYRYFNPANPEYAKQEFEHMERLNNGDVCFLGCVAEANLSYPIGGGSCRLEVMTSGGLWGIESDSDKDYMKETEMEQVADLREHLAHFGIELPEDIEYKVVES